MRSRLFPSYHGPRRPLLMLHEKRPGPDAPRLPPPSPPRAARVAFEVVSARAPGLRERL